MIVIDSSYALACVMPDELRPVSMDEVLSEALQAPFLWPVELASALRGAVRRRRLDADQARLACVRLQDLDVEIAGAPHEDPLRFLDFAASHRLTPHDGVYLDLALTRRSALATRDSELMAAAERIGITVYA
ncbi:type II toxin-antitoxin system VapC family toxin [Aquabacterium sp. J223]|uniref:type II toxin-antitoxin system VapC family toxin n=1 Tax=Aquabacterium sp. J223 TaxID=2898431 RepID=UPI0021ADA51E|nr:type II toxin-antitoxin system VapC family toxin [Aquabacterium sp. J223]UUX95126.1 type II toxin-antitoxin system VapC family toxin [Aquabacterium sp. J223]